ncbi:MAG: recombination protein RecR [Deltaproteobacteria bacterium]|nr:recombination protein RecR [Candidatus Zymogenaceae bacterium]
MAREDPIKNLIDALKRLPGVGEKTAQRFAYFIIGMTGRDARLVAQAIVEVKERIKVCSICYNLTETDPCPICTDTKRDRSIICVLEEPRDLIALEKSGSFKGVYHVLGGLVSPITNVGVDELRIEELRHRVSAEGVREVIIATNPTKEGELTSHVIRERLTDMNVKITRIAQGLPAGGDIEYFDSQTLTAALTNRREL